MRVKTTNAMLTDMDTFCDLEGRGVIKDGVGTSYALWKSLNADRETCCE